MGPILPLNNTKLIHIEGMSNKIVPISLMAVAPGVQTINGLRIDTDKTSYAADFDNIHSILITKE